MSREMNIRWFACSLTVLSLLAATMSQAALNSQSTPGPSAASAKPATGSPIRFEFPGN